MNIKNDKMINHLDTKCKKQNIKLNYAFSVVSSDFLKNNKGNIPIRHPTTNPNARDEFTVNRTRFDSI